MRAKVTVKHVLFILLIAPLVTGQIFIDRIPSAEAQPTALDMILDVEGYVLDGDLYTYSEYVGLMTELGIVPSDFILGEEPVTIILASYQNGDAYVWLEVFEFESEEAATTEYDLQAEDVEYISGLGYQGNNGPIYQRFAPRERVFVHDRFLFLFFYSPLDNMEAYGMMDDLLPSFISHILETVGTSASEPPEISVDAAWGVEPGDVITWHVDDTTFTGSMGTGTSQSHEEWDGTWEIVDVRDGHILVKQRSVIEYVSTEDETRVRVDVPYDSYTWHTPDEDGVSIVSEDGSPAGVAIFPLELNGVSLADLVYGGVDHLPEREITESDEYITVHGNTPSYSGFTPIETSWKDVTVHRGTGIVTASEFYYNNNEYSITTSTDIFLLETSFSLSSRVPVILSLTASMTLSAATLTEGDQLRVNVRIRDQDGEPVDSAEVTVTFNEQVFTLSPEESGEYAVSLSTDDMQEGTYGVHIAAEKSGHQGITDSGSVVIQKRASSQTAAPSPSGQTGIPSFPQLSVALGAAIATLIAAKMRQRD